MASPVKRAHLKKRGRKKGDAVLSRGGIREKSCVPFALLINFEAAALNVKRDELAVVVRPQVRTDVRVVRRIAPAGKLLLAVATFDGGHGIPDLARRTLSRKRRR
jgi:hypothetical protein